jgi:hypothetical protein
MHHLSRIDLRLQGLNGAVGFQGKGAQRQNSFLPSFRCPWDAPIIDDEIAAGLLGAKNSDLCIHLNLTVT